MCPVKIVHSTDDFVVAAKKAGIHSAPLKVDETDSALAFVAQDFPQVLTVQGKKEVEGGLIHRIDYDTAGLLLFALNQDFYNHMMACQDEGLFKKGYRAYCQYQGNCIELLGGFPPDPSGLQCDFIKKSISHGSSNPSEKNTSPISFTVKSGFRAFGPGRKQVRPVTEQSSKFSQRKVGGSKQGSSPMYSTELSITKTHEKSFVVEASITKGYRHQVRCHLAWCGLPIIGDPLYNPTKNPLVQAFPDSSPTDSPAKQSSQQMQFFATSLSFPLMVSGENLTFTISPEEI